MIRSWSQILFVQNMTTYGWCVFPKTLTFSSERNPLLSLLLTKVLQNFTSLELSTNLPTAFCVQNLVHIFWLRIHRRKLGSCIWLGVSHKIFAQLSTKYTFSERLRNEVFKSTTNLVILTFTLEIWFEMFKTTPFASEAYLRTLLFARVSFLLSSIFNILNTNTVFPLRFLALRFLVANFQSQKLHTLALLFILRLISQKIIGIFKKQKHRFGDGT